MDKKYKRKKYKKDNSIIEIANGTIKVFAGLAIVPILIADGFVIQDFTIDHTKKICPLTSILGLEHQVKQINNMNKGFEAFSGKTKIYTFDKPIKETRMVPYLEDVKLENDDAYITAMRYKEVEIDSSSIEITASEDEVYIVDKKTAEIVNILKLYKK